MSTHLAVRPPSIAEIRLPSRQIGAVLLALAGLVRLAGCATGSPRGSLTSGVGPHSRVPSFRHHIHHTQPTR